MQAVSNVTVNYGFFYQGKLEMTTDWKTQHFPSAVGCFVHWLAQELIEGRNSDNIVRSSCVWLVTDSVAFPERLHAASHCSELSLVPCDVAVCGVG